MKNASNPFHMNLNYKRFLGWFVFVIFTLLVPFIAMRITDEVNWELNDFLAMGVILSGIGMAYEFIVRRSKNTSFRMAAILGLVAVFLLFWVNAAVGIVGNEKQNAHLLYIVIFLVVLTGAFISRFRAKGMSITLLIAAVVQLFIPITAIIIWPPSEIAWTPSVPGVFLLNGFFALLFYLSSVLFRRSANNEKH